MEDLASKKPTPGGGAAAAIAGAMAAALVEMVCELTRTPEFQNVRSQGREKRLKLLKLSDRDCEAFDAVMAAYKTKDKKKVKKALLGAIRVPEETKRLAVEIERLAKIAIKKGNKNATSDAKTALYLAQAAQKGAEENIKINQEAIAKI